jgi:hypothetical protein
LGQSSSIGNVRDGEGDDDDDDDGENARDSATETRESTFSQNSATDDEDTGATANDGIFTTNGDKKYGYPYPSSATTTKTKYDTRRLSYSNSFGKTVDGAGKSDGGSDTNDVKSDSGGEQEDDAKAKDNDDAGTTLPGNDSSAMDMREQEGNSINYGADGYEVSGSDMGSGNDYQQQNGGTYPGFEGSATENTDGEQIAVESTEYNSALDQASTNQHTAAKYTQEHFDKYEVSSGNTSEQGTNEAVSSGRESTITYNSYATGDGADGNSVTGMVSSETAGGDEKSEVDGQPAAESESLAMRIFSRIMDIARNSKHDLAALTGDDSSMTADNVNLPKSEMTPVEDGASNVATAAAEENSSS